MPEEIVNNKNGASKEPQVVAEVLKELGNFSEQHKLQYDKLNKDITGLREAVDESEKKTDPLITEKIQKFSEAAATRQDELDKSINKRIDGLEAAFQRTGKGAGTDVEALGMKEAQEFRRTILASKNQLSLASAEGEVDVGAYKTYKETFNRFLRKHNDALSDVERKSLTVGTDPDGGILVPTQMENRIYEKIFESDPIRQLASTTTTSTGGVEWMVDFNEAGAVWVGEQEAPGTTTTAEWKKKRIDVHEIAAEPRATLTLLEDVSIDIEAWHNKKVADQFSRTESASFVSGDGVSKPRGFLTYTAGTTQPGQIEQTNMGAAASLTTDGFIDVMFSLVEGYLGRGTWLMNRLTVAETMKLKDGDGNYIWRVGLAPGIPSSIIGVPVRMSTTMPVVAANSLSVAIADWPEAYMVVDRKGISIIRDSVTAKPFIKFYTRKRVGGDVTNFQAIKIGKVAV